MKFVITKNTIRGESSQHMKGAHLLSLLLPPSIILSSQKWRGA